MSVELDVDAAYGASFITDSFEKEEEKQTTHYHKIFAPPFYPVESRVNATLGFQTKESQKAAVVVRDRLDKKITGETKVEGELRWRIGPGGVVFDGAEVKGTAKDDNGNQLDVQVTYDPASGTADVSVGGGKTSK
jgi:hypothetical protein